MTSPPTDPDARRLVEELDLEPHPEGGWFSRVWTAAAAGATAEIGASVRPSGSAIQFLLEGGTDSSWHRVDAWEMWVHSRGAPLQVRVSDGSTVDEVATLGSGDDEVPQYAVDPGRWQSARSLGSWTLVVCVVVPGFMWEGFELAAPHWNPGAR